MKKQKLKLKWNSKNIYWHKIIWIDLPRIKKYNFIKSKNSYKLGKLIGFHKIEKKWETFDDKSKDIIPYIIFKYIGKCLYSKNSKERKRNFEKAKKSGEILI